MSSTCPCGSTRTVSGPTLSGPHYAKLVCEDCGRFLRWLPAPGSEGGRPPDWLLEAAEAYTGEPVELRGTPKQIGWAETIRHRALLAARHRGDDQLVAVFGVIVAASWFIANRARNAWEVRWPTRGQVAGRIGECVAPGVRGER